MCGAGTPRPVLIAESCLSKVKSRPVRREMDLFIHRVQYVRGVKEQGIRFIENKLIHAVGKVGYFEG